MRLSDVFGIPGVARAVVRAEEWLFRRRLREPLRVAFAINRDYVRQLGTTLVSLLRNNPGKVDVAVLSTDVTEEVAVPLRALEAHFPGLTLRLVPVDARRICPLKMNSGLAHISRETFFRYLLPILLPDWERVLYLDADLLVCGSLRDMWATPLQNAYAAGVPDSYVRRTGYDRSLGLRPEERYVNAGVLLLNLEAMRRENLTERLFAISAERSLRYMDQDAINLVFRGRIRPLPERYNVTSDSLRRKQAPFRGHPAVLHYSGEWKPWECDLPLGAWRYRVLQRDWERMSGMASRVRVGLLVDEFFGGAGTAFGGYGFLARYGVCRYLPCADIQVDVLLNPSSALRRAKAERVDRTLLWVPPKRKRRLVRWLRRQRYDLYLSIEMTDGVVFRRDPNRRKKLLFWIQDPRPKSDWEEIALVKRFPEPSYWNQRVYDWVHCWFAEGRIRFLTQAHCLNQKAVELYRLPHDVPVEFLPNPIALPYTPEAVAAYPKRNSVVFLGRIESIKRGWLFCEIARKMPDLEFHLIGQTFRDRARNEAIMDGYRAIPNLHFEGHLEGEAKYSLLLDAKILVNTSAHEALPISFLEALACGTLLVSNQNPDGLTERFGAWVGPVLGDGDEGVPRFVDAIRRVLSDEPRRWLLASEAVKYVHAVHAPDIFRDHLRAVIKEEVERAQ